MSFWKPFKDAMNDLQLGDAALSASVVLPWTVRLRRHCAAVNVKPVLTEIASVCVQRLDELMSPISLRSNSIHMLYKVATFLSLKLQQLKMLVENEKQCVINAVKEMADDLGLHVTVGDDDHEVPAKRAIFHEFQEGAHLGTMESSISIFLYSEI